MTAVRRARQGPVVTAIVGNLGNQLFQFAVTKALQPDPTSPVVLDTRLEMEWPVTLATVLREGSYRRATTRELLRLGQAPKLRRGQRTLIEWHDRIAPLRHRGDRVLFEEADTVGFDPRIADVSGPAYFRGYFQSETYFENSKTEVLDAFRAPRASVGNEVEALRAAAGPEQPLVGLSLRTDLDYQHFGWVLPAAFYEEAVDRLEHEIGPVSIVVFGDVAADCERAVTRLVARPEEAPDPRRGAALLTSCTSSP